MKKKQILVADRLAGTQTVLNVLGQEYEVTTVHSFAQALELLEAPWDAILCGIHFDDSRMFDFAESVTTHAALKNTPLVIFRDLDSELDATFFRSIKISAKIMGAADFVDLFDLKLRFGIDKADQMFRSIIVGLIDLKT